MPNAIIHPTDIPALEAELHAAALKLYYHHMAWTKHCYDILKDAPHTSDIPGLLVFLSNHDPHSRVLELQHRLALTQLHFAKTTFSIAQEKSPPEAGFSDISV